MDSEARRVGLQQASTTQRRGNKLWTEMERYAHNLGSSTQSDEHYVGLQGVVYRTRTVRGPPFVDR
eukprot:6916430-Lingulodinium_polyedra.AAC.1